MPTSFVGLFFLSTALSLVATLIAAGVQALMGRIGRIADEDQPRLR